MNREGTPDYTLIINKHWKVIFYTLDLLSETSLTSAKEGYVFAGVGLFNEDNEKI